VLATQLPPLVGALGLAAVFSAEVSTCDAILFMLSTSLSKDLYKRFINPQADDRRVLLVARLAAVAGGVGGVLLATQLATVIAALGIFYSLLAVSLFVPVVGGLFVPRATAFEALASMTAGIGTLLFLTYLSPVPAAGILNANLLSLGAAALAFFGVLLVRRKES
jgi:SSS family solute:Na+ symporter